MMKYKLIIIVSFLLFFSVNINSQEFELIKIETNDLEMIFSTRPNDPVRFQYWGDKLFDAQDVMPKVNKKQRALEIYPAYGGTWELSPALRLTQSDGVLTTELVYVSSERKNIDENREEVIINMKDKLYPVYVNLRFIAYKKENIISQSVSIHHTGKGIIKVDEMASCYLPIMTTSYYLTYFTGNWGAEMQTREERLVAGTKVIDSKKGIRTTRSECPFFLLSTNKEVEENAGEVYAGALAWSGNYSMSFHVDHHNTLHILAGMNPFAATYNLEANKTLKSPEMILTYSSKGKGVISRNYHDWVRKYGMAHGDKIHSVLLNSWEGTYFSFDEKKVTDMIDNSAELGVEMFVLDDGWFGNKYPRNNDKAGLGDWQVNKEKLPRGIGYLANYAVSKGLKFGIWIEPEMVNPESEIAKKHPEWVVKSGKRDIPKMRNQWLLDLSNPKVQDFIVQTFDDVIAMSPNISYIKWDANRHVNNVGSEYLPKDRQTHFWYEYITGLYSIYERIRAKHPDIEIQACSSGGGRMDFGSLKYHDEFWTSDNTNALDRIFIQYGVSTFFPAITMASHVSASPNHQTSMNVSMKFRFDVAMSGRLGIELQPKNIPANELDFVKNAVKTYKETVRPIVQLGDLYRLSSPFDDSGWASLMYVSKDKKQAVYFLYSLKYHVNDRHVGRFDGLNPQKRYKLRELNKINGKKTFYADGDTFTGDFLMKHGIRFDVSRPFHSTVVLLEEQ